MGSICNTVIGFHIGVQELVIFSKTNVKHHKKTVAIGMLYDWSNKHNNNRRFRQR